MHRIDELAAMTAPGGSGNAEYDALPEPIKLSYSPHEWLWLTDSQKAALIQQECEPEW